MAAPRTGACAPWISSDRLGRTTLLQAAITHAKLESAKPNSGYVLSDDDIAEILADCVFNATETLYKLSGRQFAGKCGPVTIRPVARPLNSDFRALVRGNWSFGGFGSTSSMFAGLPPVVSPYGPAYAPEIELYDFPVRSIDLVKIDGVVIPPDEYELREFKRLVRLRPTSTFTPTERWGWPTSQIPDEPDDQEGTFSITYTFGADPGVGGRNAVLVLAQYMALPQFGDSTRWPSRVSSFTRQGVSAQVVSPIDMLNKGATGIPEVDLWILAVNPTRARRQAVVWSPDRAPNRRQSNVTNN